MDGQLNIAPELIPQHETEVLYVGDTELHIQCIQSLMEVSGKPKFIYQRLDRLCNGHHIAVISKH